MTYPNKAFSLDVATPEELPQVLHRAAEAYRVSALELRATWNDATAGRIWDFAARELEKAAMRVETEWRKENA